MSQQGNNNPPEKVAADILRSKRQRNAPINAKQNDQTNTNKKKPKKSRTQQLDDDSEDDATSATALQKSSSTTSRGSDVGSGQKALQKSSSTSSRGSDFGSGQNGRKALSSQEEGDGSTPPKHIPNVFVSSAAKLSSAERAVLKGHYTSPSMHGITPDSPDAKDGPEHKMIYARVVEATNDITPRLHGLKAVPFLYWDTHQPTLCAVQLITRFPDLVSYAETHYHGVPQMAHRWATKIRTKANNERAAQIRNIKQIWFNSYSKLSLAYSYATSHKDTNEENDEDDGNDEEFMTITDAVRDSGVEGIDDLRNLLRSDAMYKNSTVFTLFCQGLESGELKHSKRLQPTTIGCLITIAHEAHFRLELWYTLSKVGFSHSSKVAHIAKRKENFLAFCKLVKKDRLDNEAAAFAQRLTSENLDGEIDGAFEPLDSSYY